LLDALGRIDSFEGFDDLFDLFERHVLGSEPAPNLIKSHASNSAAGETPPDAEQSAPGPRGISVASLNHHPGNGKQLNKDDLIADFLKALIRDLAASNSEHGDGEKDEDEVDSKGGGKQEKSAPPLSRLASGSGSSRLIGAGSAYCSTVWKSVWLHCPWTQTLQPHLLAKCSR
jgi:hypothetical protein